jgi:hypothetical protein
MDAVPPAGGSLSDDEVRQLWMLLARFAAHDLDQFDHWQVDTRYGPVFIDIVRMLPAGTPDRAYMPIWPLPDRTST